MTANSLPPESDDLFRRAMSSDWDTEMFKDLETTIANTSLVKGRLWETKAPLTMEDILKTKAEVDEILNKPIEGINVTTGEIVNFNSDRPMKELPSGTYSVSGSKQLVIVRPPMAPENIYVMRTDLAKFDPPTSFMPYMGIPTETIIKETEPAFYNNYMRSFFGRGITGPTLKPTMPSLSYLMSTAVADIALSGKQVIYEMILSGGDTVLIFRTTRKKAFTQLQKHLIPVSKVITRQHKVNGHTKKKTTLTINHWRQMNKYLTMQLAKGRVQQRKDSHKGKPATVFWLT